MAVMAFLLAAQVGLGLLPDDPRYCYVPAAVPRTADGAIARSAMVRYQFRRLYPCPATGARYGACPGWAIDHVVPLACGGCDRIDNLQWLPAALKSCSGELCKDRWERGVYCPHG